MKRATPAATTIPKAETCIELAAPVAYAMGLVVAEEPLTTPVEATVGLAWPVALATPEVAVALGHA